MLVCQQGYWMSFVHIQHLSFGVSCSAPLAAVGSLGRYPVPANLTGSSERHGRGMVCVWSVQYTMDWCLLLIRSCRMILWKEQSNVMVFSEFHNNIHNCWCLFVLCTIAVLLPLKKWQRPFAWNTMRVMPAIIKALRQFQPWHSWIRGQWWNHSIQKRGWPSAKEKTIQKHDLLSEDQSTPKVQKVH